MEELTRGAGLWLWIVRLPPLVLAITVHEVAHGWVAKQCGDLTADKAGRLTLNPIRHVDLIGTIIVPVALYFLTPILFGARVLFGWAKPVPVNFAALRRPKRDLVLVAAAGPASNLVMASLWALLMVLSALYLPIVGQGALNLIVEDMARFGILANIFLAVFNMIPIPPLDGGRVLAGLLPRKASRVMDWIEPFGIFIVFGVLVLDAVAQTGILLPLLLRPVLGLEQAYYSLGNFFASLAGVS